MRNLAQPTAEAAAELQRLGIANQKRRRQLEAVKFLRHMNTGEKQDFVRTIECMKAAAITVPAFLDFAAVAARDFAAAASGGRFVFSENRSSKRKKGCRREEMEKMTWQPIETAPKDGRIFVTINETGHCCSMFYHDGDMVPWQQRPTFPFRPVLWGELPQRSL